jgi:hypothetical protein
MPRPFANIPLYLLFVLFIFLCMAGCSGNSEDINPKVKDLSKQLGNQIHSLTELLLEPLSNDDPKAVEEVLSQFYLRCSDAGQTIENSAIVLDEKGVTFAQRSYAPGHPQGVALRPSAMDYGSYKIVQKALKSGKTEVGVVYLAQDRLYVVCHPVGKSKPVGLVVLGILGSYLEARLGVSGEEFLSMNFNS